MIADFIGILVARSTRDTSTISAKRLTIFTVYSGYLEGKLKEDGQS